MFLYGSATSIKTIYHANHQYYNSHMRPVRLLSAALLLIISLTYLQAQESYPLSLVVEQSSQPEEVIPLTDIQKITFADGKMQMHYTQKANYSAAFACKDVTKCTFSTSKKPTALPLIASPVVSSYKLLSDGENIFIEGLVAGQGYMVGKTKSTIRQNKKYNLRRGKSPSKRSDKMAKALLSRNRERGVPWCGTPLSW